jgi:hypothetical protein
MSQSSSSHALRSIFEKIWAAHLVKALDDGRDLIFITRHVLQETTSAPAFEKLRKAGRAVRHPELTVATQDHIVSTEPNRDEATNPGGLELLRLMRANAYASRIRHFGVDDPRQGIVHVIGPRVRHRVARLHSHLWGQPHLDGRRARRARHRRRHQRGRSHAGHPDARELRPFCAVTTRSLGHLANIEDFHERMQQSMPWLHRDPGTGW